MISEVLFEGFVMDGLESKMKETGKKARNYESLHPGSRGSNKGRV